MPYSPSSTSRLSIGSISRRPTRSLSIATVRLRTKVTKVTKGPGSRAAGLATAYKLIESAQTRWRAVIALHLVALVRAGVVFEKGVTAERSEESENEVAA